MKKLVLVLMLTGLISSASLVYAEDYGDYSDDGADQTQVVQDDDNHNTDDGQNANDQDDSY